MKLYTIAETQSVVYGHGDFGTEQKIVRGGGYGSGDFPPVFRTKRRAEKYLAKTELLAFTNKVVVELRLEE